MNKIVKAMSLIALTAVFSFSQETLRFGARAGFNLNLAHLPGAADVGLGMGYGGGVQASIPIVKSPIITFNPEVDFFYRSLYSVEFKAMKTTTKLTEFAISIPLVFHYVPVEGQPYYVGLGAQFDIPLVPEMDTDYGPLAEQLGSKDGKTKFEDRTMPDIAFVVEAGYRITDNINVDVRYIWGFSSISTVSGDNSSFDQIGIGISYFF